MKTIRKGAAFMLAAGLAVAGLAGTAQAAGGNHGGGGFSHGGGGFSHSGGGFGHGGGGFHGGGFHGGYGHRGGYYGYGYGLGLGLGLGALAYYGTAPYTYGYYDGGYDDYSDAGPPPADVAPEGAAPGAWYYCDNPDGYYPYVSHCNDAWRAVPPVPPPQNDGD